MKTGRLLFLIVLAIGLVWVVVWVASVLLGLAGVDGG